MDSPGLVSALPGGLTTTISGGSRNKLNLLRPWQPLFIKVGECPFETRPQNELNLVGLPDGWRVIKNSNTPHKNHSLIIPQECWDTEKLWSLGGYKSIYDVLKITSILLNNCLVGNNFTVCTHIGWGAGQNVFHYHVHVFEVRVRKPLSILSYDRLNMARIKRGDMPKGFSYFAEGVCAGEILVLPWHTVRLGHENAIVKLATAINYLVHLTNTKYTSTQGLMADYSLTMRFNLNGRLIFLDLAPRLTNWGAPEYSIAHLEGGPITLAWPHSVTAEYLSS